ncbi:MAG: hypothetical protein HUJ54_13275 [Erysipelotrichaceae bacterium]|nr:hypothetical protein [Erysipelotrichaceae bacterium]
MKKTMISILGSVLAMISFLSPLSLFASEQSIQVTLPPVAVKTNGVMPTGGYTEEIVITPINPSSPMPEGTVDGIYTITQTIDQDNAVIELPAIEFDQPDQCEYLVEFKGSGKQGSGTFDQSKYIVTLSVYVPDDGIGLKSCITARKDDLKTDGLQAVNSFTGGKKTDSVNTAAAIQRAAFLWLSTAAVSIVLLLLLGWGVKKENESEISD